MKFRTVNFVLSSLLVIWLAASCSPKAYFGLVKADERNSQLAMPEVVPAGYQKLVYRTSVHLFNNQITGLLLVKKMPDNSIRTVFTNELGMKFFDFEFRGNDFKVMYCFKQFKHRIIINTLRNDLNLFVMSGYSMQKPVILFDTLNRYNVLKFKYNRLNNYYYSDSLIHKMVKIEQWSAHRKKVWVKLADFDHNYPKTIKMVHMNFGLRMRFDLIENN